VTKDSGYPKRLKLGIPGQSPGLLYTGLAKLLSYGIL